MRSPTFSILPIFALATFATLAAAGPLPIQADYSVLPTMSDIDSAAAPGLMKRDFESWAKHVGKDTVDAAESVYGGTLKRDIEYFEEEYIYYIISLRIHI